MIRGSRNLVRLLPFMTVLMMLALAPSALAQDDEDEEPAKVEVVNRGMVVNNIQFDSWVFGNIGSANAGVARNKLDSLLTLSVEDLERSCGLTPVQKKKLMLAGRGDIKRFFDTSRRSGRSSRRPGTTRISSGTSGRTSRPSSPRFRRESSATSRSSPSPSGRR